MHDAAERGSVRGAGQVVVHHRRYLFGQEAVAEPVEQLPQLGRRQKVEQHQRVGLLGRLVAVHVVVLRLQDAVEALDVAVLAAEAVPIQVRQLAITLELADDAVVERDVHPAADVVPVGQFGTVQPQCFQQVQPVRQRQQIQRIDGAHDHPHRHHVRIRVVVDAVVGGVGIAGVELVGPDDALDAEAVALFVVGGQADEEACDLGDQLRAVVDQVGEVAGDLVERPRTVGDGDADVVRAGAGVGIPVAAARIEVQPLTFLAAVAAGLPGKHRARMAGRAGGVPGLGQAPIAIAQQGPGDHRQPQVEYREDEQLIPEDVAAIRLTVQSAGRHPGVEVGGVR